MSLTYTLFFTSAGFPKTGLSPSITTYKKISDNTDVASPPAISEIGGGGYKFAAAPSEPYFVVVDGGAALADYERYKAFQITPNDGGLDAAVSTRAPEAGGNVAAIKGKTDLLPASPANEANVESHVANVLNAYDPPTKAELDAAVLPLAQDATVAKEAGVQGHAAAALAAYDPPTRTEATSDRDAIIAQVNDNEGKLDIIDAVVDAIKARTDRLPSDPASQAAVLAAIAALNDLTVGELLAGDLSDSRNFPANSLADLLRKLFWTVCNRLVIDDASGVFTAYKSDGVTPATTGSISDDGGTTTRRAPTWP